MGWAFGLGIAMASWDIAGSWSGEFWYHPNDSLPIQPSAVSFTLTARQGWFGRFQGVIEDDPAKGPPELASVRGRVAGHRVKFLKRYSVFYVTLGDRVTTIREHLQVLHGVRLERDVLPAPIRYHGEYDPLEGAVRGTWEIRRHRIRFRSAWRLLQIPIPAHSGGWVMRREFG
jgi:hypothetical protein